MSLVIVQSLKSCSTPCLSSTISQSLLRFMSIELVMLSNHFIFCCPFSFYLQSFPASKFFPMSPLFASDGQCMGSFNLSNSPNEYSGLISFRVDWFDLLAVQGTLKRVFTSTIRKHQFFSVQPSLRYNSHIHT